MKLRLAAEDDAGILCRLGQKAFDQAFRTMNNQQDFEAYISEAFALDTIKAEVEDAHNAFFLALDGEEPAGYVKLRAGDAPGCVTLRPAVEIARFYLLKPWWGQGCGDAIMEEVLALARQKGFRSLWLSTWKKNGRGNAFYRRWGFTAVGEQTFTLGSDVQQDYIMCRPTDGTAV